MINAFIFKKYGALLMCSLLTVICFAVGAIFYNFWIGLACMGAGLLVGILLGNILLKNPFSALLEGKGILALDLNSTGVINPFIVSVNPPYIWGKNKKKEVNDVFDREAVMHLGKPVKLKKSADIKEDGTLEFSISKDEYNKGRFALFHYPVLIWNSQIDSILTKDFLAEQEKSVFAEHGVLYLNRKMEELTSVVRDFGRYVVELTKPQGSIWANKWTWIIIVIVAVIIIALFAPAIIKTLQQTGSAAGDAFTTSGNAVTPR